MKRAIAMILCAVMAMSLCGCVSDKQDKSQSKRFVSIEKGINWSVFTDTETGVQYIYVSYSGVCPLFNADGTLHIEEAHNGE